MHVSARVPPAITTPHASDPSLATIAVAVGLLVYSLFGDSWTRRLAKRVKHDFEKQHVGDSFIHWVQSVSISESAGRFSPVHSGVIPIPGGFVNGQFLDNSQLSRGKRSGS